MDNTFKRNMSHLNTSWTQLLCALQSCLTLSQIFLEKEKEKKNFLKSPRLPENQKSDSQKYCQ